MSYLAQVDTRYFIQGVPAHTPLELRPPILSPSLAPYYRIATGYVIHEVQSRATTNEARAMHYFACAENQWNSHAAAQVVALTLDIAFMESTTRRSTVDAVLEYSSQRACAYLCSRMAVQSGLVNQLPQNQAVYNLNAELDQVMRQIQAFSAPQPYRNPAPNHGDVMRVTGNRPVTGVFRASEGVSRGSDFRGIYTPESNQTVEPLHTVQEINPMRKTFTPVRPIQQKETVDKKRVRFAEVFPKHPQNLLEPVASEAIQPLMQTQPVVAPVTPSVSHVQHEAPVCETHGESDSKESDDPLMSFIRVDVPENPRPYEFRQLADMTYAVPAVLYPELRDKFEPSQIRMVYDATKYALFYQVDAFNRKIKETLVERNEEMEYMDHELNLRAKYKHDDEHKRIQGVVTAPNWDLAKGFAQHPSQPVSSTCFFEEAIEDELVVDKDNNVMTVNQVSIDKRIEHAASVDDMMFLAMRYVDRAVDPNDAFEVYAAIATPLRITGESFNEAVHHVKGKKTYQEMNQALLEITPQFKELGYQANTVQKAIDQQLTDEVNRILHQQLGISHWTIQSFLTDYNDLIREMESHYGDFPVKLFESTHRHTAYSLKNMSKGRSIAIGYRASMLILPWEYEAMGIDLNDGGALVEAHGSELYGVLNDIFVRAQQDDLRMDRHFVVTRDNVLLEVRRGLFNPSSIMLHPVAPMTE